jgi:hypothetical protein
MKRFLSITILLASAAFASAQQPCKVIYQKYITAHGDVIMVGSDGSAMECRLQPISSVRNVPRAGHVYIDIEEQVARQPRPAVYAQPRARVIAQPNCGHASCTCGCQQGGPACPCVGNFGVTKPGQR